MEALTSLKLPATLENLELWMRTISDCARGLGFDPKRISEMGLALEEALVNICSYSYPEGHGEAEIICKADDHNLIVEVIDSGIPFDMTELPDPDTTTDISERRIGGLGIFLVKKMANEVHYHREGDRNILNLVFRKG